MGRNDDESLRQRPIVGDAEINSGLKAHRRQGHQPGQRPAGELHGRTASRQIDDAHVAPPDPLSDTGPECLRTGLLGGKAVGGGGYDHFLVLGPALGPGALGVGKYPIEKTIAMTLDHLGDAADVDQVGPDADNHARSARVPAAGPPVLLRPRSIAERIARTVSPSPTNKASPIMK